MSPFQASSHWPPDDHLKTRPDQRGHTRTHTHTRTITQETNAALMGQGIVLKVEVIWSISEVHKMSIEMSQHIKVL